MKKITFIITAFNEENNVVELHRQINEAIKEVENYKFEILFIENGSTDKTLEVLKTLKSQDKRVSIVKLSRNFILMGE